MSPEEAHAVIHRIEVLGKIGEALRREFKSVKSRIPGTLGTPEFPIDPIYRYKLNGWLGETAALVKKSFADNPVFVARTDVLAPSANGDKPIEPAIAEGLDLLDTIKQFVFIDPHSTASEPLKELIEQTLRERYFKSWEVRLLAIAFGFVTACFFGGTIYLGWQVLSVASQADAARKSIDSARDAVLTTSNEIVKRIEARAADESNAQLNKLRTAIDSSSKSIAELNAQLVHNQSLLTQQFTQGQTRIQETIEAQVKAIPSNANAYVESRRPFIDAAIEKGVGEKVQEAAKQIQDSINSVSIRKKNFEDNLPEMVKFAENRVKEFNEIVNRYSGRIDEIFGRFSDAQNITPIEAVARTLGHAFWLTLVALFLSSLAFLPWVWAFIHWLYRIYRH